MKIEAKCCNPANMGGTRGMAAVDWIVVHYTSNLGDTAKNNADYFNREALKDPASAHYFVDETDVWNSVPIYRIAYHCGAKTYKHPRCRNTNSIGVEICMLDKHAVIRMDAIRHAAELVRWLMAKYGIDRDHVIRHYDVTGKDCPAPMVDDPRLWEKFLDMLCEQEEEMTIYKTYEDCPEWAKPTVSKLVRLGLLKGDERQQLNLEHNALRNLVINDRAGLYK
ncbi:MAG: N-acetylmuramoyl-L-alanine amidase [Clostridiales bacterium]|nr:N-acetylmuramoyl-L-alanine amidase [Clostridiales bacterium]